MFSRALLVTVVMLLALAVCVGRAVSPRFYEGPCLVTYVGMDGQPRSVSAEGVEVYGDSVSLAGHDYSGGWSPAVARRDVVSVEWLK